VGFSFNEFFRPKLQQAQSRILELRLVQLFIESRKVAVRGVTERMG
jgi:hypothetical protein